VSRKFPPDDQGAVANLLWDTANELVSRGVQIRVLTIGSSVSQENPRTGLTVIRVPRPSRLWNPALRVCRELHRWADIVHLHDAVPMGLSLLWCISSWRISKFWTLHNLSVLCRNSVLWPPASDTRNRPIQGSAPLCYLGSEPRCRRCFGTSVRETLSYTKFLVTRRILRRLLTRFRIIVPSQAAGRVLRIAWGIDFTVIPNGTSFPPLSLQLEGSNPFSHDLALSFAGRIVPEKGLDLLIRAASQVSHTRSMPLSVLVAGSGRPEYLQHLNSLSKKSGITLNLTGWIPKQNLVIAIRRTRGLVVPSRGFETFGMAALDGASAAIPVVVSNAGGLAELGQGYKAPFVFQREDLNSLVEAVDRLLFDNGASKRNCLLFRKIASHRYAVPRHVDRLLKLYEESS